MIKQLLLFLMLLITPNVMASPKVSESLMNQIARSEGIPLKLLKSVAYVESKFHPWSLNVKGQSYVFSTQKQAETHLEQALQQGHTSIDIGCAQINWHWHGKNFKAAKELLSPAISLRYAARLLKAHYRLTGSWMKAALLYHSSNHQHQQIYRQRLIRYLRQGRTV